MAPKRFRPAAALLATTAILLVEAAGAAPSTPLTGGAGLARVYDHILDARFDRVAPELERACGPAPPEACRVLDATARWWRIQLDPADRALDRPFTATVDGAIAATDAWVAREPHRAEAWFYRGGAYAARVQWRVLRDEKLAAARDGKRIKDSLDRAIALAPGLEDAYFGLGLYEYYADVAPAGAKFLRWLLLLPGGDRVRGLQRMLRTRDRGELLRGEAAFQLQILYLWYERAPERALRLLDELKAKYPANPLFPLQIAEVQDVYFHDATASLDASRALIDAARQRRVNLAPLAEAAARLGAARQLDALYETDRAIEHLKAAIDSQPSAPFGALARAHLELGRAYVRLGQKEAADVAFRAAIAASPAGDPLGLAARARAGLRQRIDAPAAEAYRAALAGWRAVQRKRLDEAGPAFDRSLALRPEDPVTRYRYAQLLLARQDDAGALTQLERVIASRPATPAPTLAEALLDAGHLLARAGQRPRAIEMYQRASGVHGAAGDTRAAASRALARLRQTSARLH